MAMARAEHPPVEFWPWYMEPLEKHVLEQQQKHNSLWKSTRTPVPTDLLKIKAEVRIEATGCQPPALSLFPTPAERQVYRKQRA